jgi:DNA-binding CsgD family transcriptional regulator
MGKHLCTFSLLISLGLAVSMQGQLDTAQLQALTNADLFASKARISPQYILPIFEQRLATAEAQDDQLLQLKLSRYLARTQHVLGLSDRVAALHQRIDSLEQLVEPPLFDQGYAMHRVAFALASKQPQEALRMLEKLWPKVESSDDALWALNWHAKTAKAYITMDDWAESLKHLLAAEELNNSLKDMTAMALLTALRGDLHWEQREPEKALSYYENAAARYEALSNWEMLLPLYTNIISLAVNLQEESKLLKYSNRLSKLQSQYGSKIGYYTAEENSVFYLIQLGKYEKARLQAEKTLRLADSLDRDPAHANYLLGLCYRGMNRYDLAAPYIEKAFNLGLKKRHFGQCTFYAHAMYQTYYWKDKFEPALQWHQTYVQYRDSVYDERKAKEIAVLEAKFEALEQTRKVELLEVQAAIEKQKQQRLWIGLLLLAIIAAVTVYAQYQRAQRRRLEQQARYEKLELEQQQLRQALEHKQRELASQVLHIQQKNAVLQQLKEGLMPTQTAQQPIKVAGLLRLIDQHLGSNEEWDLFLQTFRSIHSSFLEKLQSLSADLTSSELRLASLLRMNLSSKEIANLLNITDEGVKKARYRLRRKIELDSQVNLQDYILGL